jgi:branched-chain amino acid transport system substrate-binding protein
MLCARSESRRFNCVDLGYCPFEKPDVSVRKLAGQRLGGLSMRTRTVATLVVAALIVVSCGNASEDDNSEGNTPGSTSSGVTTTTADLTKNVPIDEEGVTDDSIRTSVVTAITNPIGTDFRSYANGIQAYYDTINDAGGIYGRDLEIVEVRDDQLGNNTAAIQATLAQDNVFAVYVATLLFTGSRALEQDNVPTFGWNINREWIGPTNFFPNEGALCFTCSRPGLPWLAEDIGADKVGVLAYNVQQSKECLEGIQASFKKYPTAEIVFTDDSLTYGVVDLSGQVAQMKDAGVGLVLTCMDRNGVFTLAKEMDKQQLDAVQSLPNAYDAEFMKANGRYFEGDYVGVRFAAFEHEPQPPAMKDFFAAMDKAGKEVDELAMHGWISATQFVTGLKLAGPEFDRQKVIQGLNGLTDFTADGLLAPIDWTKQHEDPAVNVESVGELDCSSTVQVKNNEFVPAFGEPGKPFRCFKTADENLTSEAPMEVPEPSAYSFAD